MMRWLGILAVALASLACGDDGGGDDDEWQVVHEDLDAALLSVWAAAPDDVWAVGADDGDGPLVLRFDGQSWRREDTGSTGDLWWVHGFAGGPVFLGGEGGTILRYDGTGFEAMTTPGTGIVFGIWGASPTDVWAVGGDQGGASGAFVWRLQGSEWGLAETFPTELSETDAIWKVFGRSADDVFFVGTGGNVLRYDGESIAPEDANTSVSLFTVHGNAERIVAVGGFGTGALIEYDGTGWTEATPPGAVQLIGVNLDPSGEGYAVGLDGMVYRRDPDGTWTTEPTDTGVFHPLHAVSIDPSGEIWAVGGRVLSEPLVEGVLLHKGPSIPTEIEP